ncbi:hypothetical protein K469DRAFT_724434 [Zopfia rhizophila CBS 207.26]|uniref:DNA2/NAM7 helicase helicase domain-containing protein n=1 Tax=Zopfia rhizophila CBS 207.26 TaxID=1314779 RepID=A0A6A6D6U7_9PEZI|nr:hypothetical protein K469DRAFT_724434 [Zopfia rhizophila CBS 207.26]
MCRYFQFSHELSEGGGERSSKERPLRAEETPKQQRAKADYIEQLWNDLDNEEYFGQVHIKALLTIRTRFGDYSTFIQLIQPFLLVITHPSFLDCLSVDTFVGGLYNFISGMNGTRVVPFFQHLCETLVNAHVNKIPSATTAMVETTLVAMESQARFNDDLPTLIDSIENTEEEQQEAPPTTTVTSTYPRSLTDITKIKIFPTREEILSDKADFLPLTDLEQPHFLTDQAERHIDTHFRLLRYDTFRELKDALKGLMHALNFGDFRAYYYPNAYISYVSFDNRRGLEVNISFPQLSWEESKRLAEGHLFFTVTERNTDTRRDHSLTREDSRGTITAKLASHNQMGIESAVRLSCQKARGVLIEFPGEVGKVNIPPPLYARQPGFTFPLKPILKPSRPHNGSISINPTSSANDPTICRALLAALTREFAFIQGPPGTGKSYLGIQLMKVLMDSKKTVDLGPVVVVWYTNHALDQFLEHLHAIGIRKIIRIGGQSQSSLLEEHNLRKVSQAEIKTRSENYLLAKLYEALDRETKRIKGDLRRVHGILKQANWSNLQYHLLRKRGLVELWSQEVHDHALDDLFERLTNIHDERVRCKVVIYEEAGESRQGALLSVGEPGRPKMPVAQLNVQRRMRPEISILEVGMVHALVRYIVRQREYSSSNIAILTPYTSQLKKLCLVMRNDFEIVLSNRDQDALEKDEFNVRSTSSGDKEPDIQVATVNNF